MKTQSESPKSAPRLMPPHHVVRDFLDRDVAAELLALASANQTAFQPAGVGRGDQTGINLEVRVALNIDLPAPYRSIVRTKVLDLLPTLAPTLGIEPIREPRLEMEMVAHRDGAFFKRHIDTRTGDKEQEYIRVLSGVYYFHAQPKAFSGGELRLYALGDASFIDIVPEHNSLVFFPSWAPHEVMPVSVPSKRFVDSRFAINCFIRRKVPPAANER